MDTDTDLDQATYIIETLDEDEVEDIQETNSDDQDHAQDHNSGGYWSESDVHRLLKVYNKHMRSVSFNRPTLTLWSIIMKEFDDKNKFSVHQVKAKLHRLKLSAKAIINNGEEGSTRWPYMTAIKEMMRLEAANKTYFTSNRGSMTWSDSETFAMMNIYKSHLPNMVMALTPQARRSVWGKIAAEVGRPRYHVQMKFQSLKYTWRRYRGCLSESSRWIYWPKMQELNSLEERIKAEIEHSEAPEDNSQETEEEEEIIDRNRWQVNETTELIETYKRHLQQLASSGLVKMKRSVYAAVARELGLTATCVQIKLVSLKSHWKSLHNRPRNSSSWAHLGILNEVMELETAIWVNLEEEDRGNKFVEELLNEPDEDVPQKNDGQHRQILNWFRKYREDDMKRHRERLAMKLKLISTIEEVFL